jgi:acyl-coenzyme A thioesterase PaaI-like protein
MADAPGAMLERAWKRLSPWPGGAWLFSRMLGFMVPYTGSISPRVLALGPGHAKVALEDRRRVRNHLRSVHAIALMNLGEVATGLAVLVGSGAGVRGILVGLSMDYLKKARGRLVAECTCEVPQVQAPADYAVAADIRDASGDVVARATARWRLAPVAAAAA